MGMLAPLYLLGALVVALPIWLHRLQTKSSEREQFSSAMLLEASERQIHVKKELRYRLLLALRVAFLLLLALAFAKPFWERPPLALTAENAGTQLLLVDLSMSMGQADVMEQARQAVREAIDAAPDGMPLMILTADDAVSVAGALQDTASARRRTVSTLAASSLRLDLGQAMAAIEAHAESLPAPVTLHVFSDFQTSGMPARFADLVPARVSRLVLHPLAPSESVNWSVKFFGQTDDGFDIGILADADITEEVAVRLVLNDTQTLTQTVSGGGVKLAQFSGLQYEPGDNRIAVSLLVDDALHADNQWYFIVENEPPAPVPLITLNTTGLAVTYLSAALESAEGRFQVEPKLAGQFDTRILSRYPWLMIDDIGLLDVVLEAALLRFLRDGGNVLAFAGERAFGSDSLPLGGQGLGAASLGGGDFLSIGQIDSAHPALTATSGWHSVNVSRSLPLEAHPDDRVLIRLENNDPFLLEQRIGAGRLLLVANGADNRWNDLPLRPVFVAFMMEVANYLSGAGNLSKIYTTGDRLPLTLIGSASGQVVDPDGQTVLSLADTTRAQLIHLDKSGIYEVYTPQGEARIAVNVDPRESLLQPVEPELLTRWQEAVTGRQEVANSAGTLMPAEPLPLWHWLLLLLALVVSGESLLANRIVATPAKV